MIEVLKGFPNGSVDRFVFSPPYFGADVDYGENYTIFKNWDEYRDFTQAYLAQMWRILADDGCISVNVDNTQNRETKKVYYHNELIRNIITRLNWNQRGIHAIDIGEDVWLKSQTVGKREARGSAAYPRTRRNHEYVLFFYKLLRGTKRKIHATTTNKEQGLFSLSSWEPTDEVEMTHLDMDLWGTAWKIPQTQDKDHPAVFPAELARRMIVYGGSADDVICDPFVGSGTTLEVAAMNGRSYIGIEQNSRFAARAAEAGRHGEKAFEKLEKKSAREIRKRLKIA